MYCHVPCDDGFGFGFGFRACFPKSRTRRKASGRKQTCKIPNTSHRSARQVAVCSLALPRSLSLPLFSISLSSASRHFHCKRSAPSHKHDSAGYSIDASSSNSAGCSAGSGAQLSYSTSSCFFFIIVAAANQQQAQAAAERGVDVIAGAACGTNSAEGVLVCRIGVWD